MMESEISNELSDKNKEIIINYPRERLQSIMMEATFTSDTNEACYIANMVLYHIREKDIVPKVTEHSGLPLASRCLVSLGFFRAHMEFLTKHRGYPSPNFYLEVGRDTFISEGKRDVGNHIKNWTDFLDKRFESKIEKKGGIEVPIFYETTSFHKAYDDPRTWKGEGFLKRGYEFDSKDNSNI